MVRLLLLCLAADEAELTHAIDKVAASGWQDAGCIRILTFSPESEKREHCPQITRKARQVLTVMKGDKPVKVVLIRGPQVDLRQLPCDELIGQHITMSKTEFLRDKKTVEFVRITGWDWRSRIEERIRHWAHGTTDLQAWRDQFRRLGQEWVADYLLQHLHFITESELGDALARAVPAVRDESLLNFGVFSHKIGKSGGIIANLITKRFPKAKLDEISAAVASRRTDSVVVMMEDGLYSATEIVGVLDSLQGTREGRALKAVPLDDPGLLQQETLLAFGIMVDYGEAVLQHYLHRMDNKLAIKLCCEGPRLEVLADRPPTVGQSTTPKQYRQQLQTLVRPWVFGRHAHASPEKRQRAQSICQTIGRELWKCYIDKQVAENGWRATDWPQGRIDRCGLGMDGLGLTVVFGHSIPKASLPLFWAKGSISVGKVNLEWQPLFQNA